MSAITPESYSKRSLAYRKMSGATFSEVAASAVAADFSNNRNLAKKSGLLDLSTLPRAGFRGYNAPTHLNAADLPVPDKPNLMSVSANGELVLRLSQKEYWVLSALSDQGAGVDALSKLTLPESACYPLYCQHSHAWFVMTGAHLPEILAKVCGVDLREEAFPVGSIAQTSVARISVVVAHHELNGMACFSILCDSAASEYLWDCLQDAMNEFGGQAIG